MSQTITVSLSDGLFQAIQHRAETTGATPAEVVEKMLEQQLAGLTKPTRTPAELEEARLRFERHFGAAGGVVGSMDNESIDADLASAYADNHEGN
jgi:hypothetical protein